MIGTKRICVDCDRGVFARGYCRAHYEQHRRRGHFDLPVADLSSVDPAVVRARLERRECPLCGGGPFASPLNHANKMHGVDAEAVKRHAGLALKPGFADEELITRLRESNAELGQHSSSFDQLERHRQAAVDAARVRRTQDPTVRQQRIDRFMADGMRELRRRLASMSDDELELDP